MNNVLVVVDMQKDFVSGPLGTLQAQQIIHNIANKILDAHENGDQVIFTRDTHKLDYLNTQEGRHLPVYHCLEHSEGHEIVDELYRLYDPNDDIIIDKSTFGSYELMDEIEFVAETTGELCEVQYVGVCTGLCVITNVMLTKTMFPETLVTVDESCCACVTPESHKRAIEAMELLQVNIIGKE